MEMMLQTQNLCKYFKKQKAVNNVSLNIEIVFVFTSVSQKAVSDI